MLPVILTKHVTSPSANCVCLQQAAAGAGNLVLNGGSVSLQSAGPFGANVSIAVLDTQRRIAIISDGDDHLVTAHIYGNRQNGQPINEVLALTNTGTATSVLDYLNVTTVAVSGAIASHVTIGTGTTASTDWIVPNFHLTPFNIDIFEELTGSVTWNLETTLDSPLGPNDPTTGATKQPNVNPVISGSTIAQQATLTTPVFGYRYTITAGTGTLAAQSQQAGIANF